MCKNSRLRIKKSTRQLWRLKFWINATKDCQSFLLLEKFFPLIRFNIIISKTSSQYHFYGVKFGIMYSFLMFFKCTRKFNENSKCLFFRNNFQVWLFLGPTTVNSEWSFGKKKIYLEFLLSNGKFWQCWKLWFKVCTFN